MADNSSLQDDELYLPRTVVNKLIKEIVPNIRVSTDARDLLLNCCTEFIHLLASEASGISEKQQKKVISPEHVVEALTILGFQEYVPDVKAVHKEYKEQASKHRKRGKSRLDKLGIPEEELARQQQQLFDEARQQQLESELMEQQKVQLGQHSAQLDGTKSANGQSDPHGSSALGVTTSQATATEETPLVSAAPISDSRPEGSGQATPSAKPVSLVKNCTPLGSLPQNSAMTMASLQATSNLLQQAIAMASAQMAATNTAQMQQSAQGQSDSALQNLLLQQPALQAALSTQVQSKQTLLPQVMQLLPKMSPSQSLGKSSESTPLSLALDTSSTANTSSGGVQPTGNNTPATSQELSVAQMMVTLAQASSSKNTTTVSGNSTSQTL